MNCATPPQNPAPCVPCVHPFEYVLELAYVGTVGPNNRTFMSDTLDRVLDKGVNFPNCGYCCPDCEGVYVLASVETFLKFAEAVGITISAAVPALPAGDILSGVLPDNPETCCSNVYASTETYLKYAEAMGMTESAAVPASPFSATTEVPQAEFVTPCCNGFDECVDELVCWATENVSRPAEVIDRIQDKGIVEYGQIQNNCTGAVTSSICKLADLFIKYQYADLTTSKAELIDRFLDKGIVISCDSNGDIHIASVETWLKYAEAVGLTESAAVPALGETTTTTTVLQ
jgi:hypothetical protein